MANYNSSYTGAQVDAAVKEIVANGITDDTYVLNANGSGGVIWGTPELQGTQILNGATDTGKVLTAGAGGKGVWTSLSNNATFSLSGTTLTITNS